MHHSQSTHPSLHNTWVLKNLLHLLIVLRRAIVLAKALHELGSRPARLLVQVAVVVVARAVRTTAVVIDPAA